MLEAAEVPEVPEVPGDHLDVGLAAGLARFGTALAVSGVVVLAAGAAGLGLAVEQAHTARTAHALEARLGVPVRLGSAEADLSGTLHLRDLALGKVFTAAEVSASIGVSTLLRGELGADEISLVAPVLRITARADGSSDVGDLLAHARGPRKAGGGHTPRKPRRIFATDGQVTLVLADLGEVHAEGLQLSPSEESLRVVTGPVDARFTARGVAVESHFGKGAIDVDWTTLRPTRAALAGGQASLHSPGAPALAFDQLMITHGTTRPHASVVDARGPTGPVHLELERETDGTLAFVARSAVIPLDALAAGAPSWLHAAGARVALDLHGRVHGRELTVAGQVAASALTVDHRLLAAQPVPLTGQLAIDLHTTRAMTSGSFSLETGKLVVKGRVEAATTDGQPIRLSLDLEVPEVACADAVAAVPPALAGPLVGLSLDGKIAGKLHAEVDANLPEATILDLGIDNGCKVLGDGPGADIASFGKGGSFTPVSTGVLRSLAVDAPGTVRVDDLPDYVPAAFIAGEDARFLMHDGFDLEQMRLSLAADLVAGKIERGGSTITQQLAKNLFLGRERTLGRKLIEAVLAWRLESLGKPRLLELYLAVIELGGGAIGLSDGAARWFGKPASKLTIAEAAFLAALTPAPQSSTRRLLAAGGLDPETGERVQVILRSMRRNHLISESQYQHARHEDLDVHAAP